MPTQETKIGFFIFCCLVSTTLQAIKGKNSRVDQDFSIQCKRNEYVDSIGRNSTGRINIGCQPLRNNLKAEKCFTAKPLQCTGSVEGCPKKAWLAGFETFSMDEGVELLRPICCTSKKVQINPNKCNMRLMLSANGSAARRRSNAKSPWLYQAITCYLMKTRAGKIRKTVLLMEACKYGKK
ncbi:hypothetical protein TTRE_0000419101 [Trichuris trichiura]|uniref:Uncharacterized protein n=1 Tax=Trichuris trichiura TaxID=36087 RepID=A0A077Z620_TRITR|nr:hypothetical protein TTRE_0000419101 [Trichuris trichiura]